MKISVLAMMNLSELAAKSCVRRSCASPMRPESVLSFFFGCDFIAGEHDVDMREGTPLKRMNGIWYEQSDEYDHLCQAFSDVVRAAGKGELAKRGGWNSSVDGIMSQVLLCDQLSRNCFRGTEEAFIYDPMAEELTMKLIGEFQKDEPDRTIPGTFYPPYMSFLLVPLMHSEEIKNHELSLEVIKQCKEQFDEDLGKIFDFQKGFLLDHTEVLNQFGRYPHRNDKLRRITTSEEQRWLDDTDNLPGWAKSQG